MACKRCRSTTLHHRLRSGCTAVSIVRRTRATAFSPGVARIGEIRYYRSDRQAVAAQTNDVIEERVVLAEPRQVDQQLLARGSFGRIAEVHNDQASALDALEPLGDRPMINCPGWWRAANLGDSLQYSGADLLRQMRIAARKICRGMPMTSPTQVAIPSGPRSNSAHASAC